MCSTIFFHFDDFGVGGILGNVRNSVSGESGFLVDPDTDPRDDESLLDVSAIVDRPPVLEGVCTSWDTRVVASGFCWFF